MYNADKIINEIISYLPLFLPLLFVLLAYYLLKKSSYNNSNNNIDKNINSNVVGISFPAIYFYYGDSYSYFDTYEELLDDLDWEDQEYIDSFYLVDSNYKKYKARIINDTDAEIYFTNEIINFEELKNLIVNTMWKEILESKDYNELVDNI